MNGNLEKMKVKQVGSLIEYRMILGENEILLNPEIGKKIKMIFSGQINCVECGKLTKKAFGQGFCYNCFAKSPENAECIIRPELCRGHLGLGRDPKWELEHHVQPHIVYLAQSSGLKVGVTRKTQIPTRWIDQGATKAIILAETENRYQAGVMEVELKSHFADKTDWRKMLKNEFEEVDLIEEKENAAFHLPSHLGSLISKEQMVYSFEYPVIKYPTKISSMGFDKTPLVEGDFNGIKGQYLFIGDNVINIRNHSGYFIDVEFN